MFCALGLVLGRQKFYTTNVAIRNESNYMGIPIRIDDELYKSAKKIAKAEFRTIPHQIEFWAQLGKCALDNPDLPIEFIKESLASLHEDKSLATSFTFEESDD